MRSERAASPRGRVWAALLFMVLGAGVGVMHNRRVGSGKPDYFAGALRYVVSGPARLLRGASGWVGGETGWITHGRSLAAENQRLRSQVADLERDNNSLREANSENERLRADLAFVKSTRTTMMPAGIVDLKLDPKFDTMVIDRGSGNGVKSKSVVVTRDGVVGRVFEVEPGTAAVLIITDQKSGVGARIQRSGAIGLCEGDYSSTLAMYGLLDTADVRVGDAVVTSGLGGVYPGGLLIGAVSEVRQDTVNGGRIVRVAPHVAFDRLEEVYVIP